MKKEVFVLPITNSPFSNNHFNLVKKLLNSHEEVIIFLLLDSNDNLISNDDKKNIIECYFTEEELKSIDIIDSLVTGDENIVSLFNEISLLNDKEEFNIHLVLDLKYSPIIASKCLKTKETEGKVVDVLYYVHRKAQLFDVKNEKLITKDVIANVNVDEIMTYNINLDAFNYIIYNNLFFMNKITNYIQGHRLKHSISVANLAYEVAEANDIKDPYRYFICALLHDVGKHTSLEVSKRVMYKHYNQYVNLPEFAYHQFVGSHICKKDFKINDEEVLDAIKWHCTGKANMTLMSKIIYACDKIDPLRGYDSSDMINAMLLDAQSGFLYVLKQNLIFLENKTNLNLEQFDYLSKECFKFYIYK